MNDANAYAGKPIETSIVLNTPFCLIRTIENTGFSIPEYYSDHSELESIFSPVHIPDSNAVFTPKNVCIIILESFSQSYRDYMPFVDSLSREGLSSRWTFANGRKSVEGIPAILSSLPSFEGSYLFSPYSGNDLSGIAAELCTNKGYSSAFFHGAPGGSLGLEAFAHITGYEKLYNKDTFGDESQYDGTWAIWDGPFLNYSENLISRMQEPFVCTIFTATSHHPFKVPEEYEECLTGGTLPMHKCIQYTDLCLREFFRKASAEPWYGNTVFAICGDHTNITEDEEYLTGYGLYEVPIIFFTPDGSLKGQNDGIIQQTDIMPTILNYLGYDRPYLSYGRDINDSAEAWTINSNGESYQYLKDGWCLIFDGEKATGLYRFKEDRLQENDLLEDCPEVAENMLPFLKAVIQDYKERMASNQLTVCTSNLR